MPGAGGTYLYLREAFQYRSGRFMPFLFIWTAVLAIPLIMSTGVIGLLKYLEYYGLQLIQSAPAPVASPAPTDASPATAGVNIFGLTAWGMVAAAAVTALVVFSLYRNISSIKKLTVALWIIMFISVAGVIAASFSKFDPRMAFSFPPDAFHFSRAFFLGLGGVLVYAVYDYLGYNTTAYMGAELKNPGKVIPRSIVFSIVGMMVIYLTMNVGILGAVRWQDVKDSNFVASLVVEKNWGLWPARIMTGLIIVTALASVFAGLLGGSRVPFNAAAR